MVYGGFFRRFVAVLIDGFIVFIPSMLLGGGYGSSAAGILLNLIYKPVFESSPLRGTPGKALMGLVVVSESGAQLTVKQALIRFVCTYISAAIALIGYLMQPFTAKRQTLHDMIAETVVLKETVPDMNFFTVWRDQLKKIFASL